MMNRLLSLMDFSKTNNLMLDHLLQPLVCERFLTDARYREGHLRVVNALP